MIGRSQRQRANEGTGNVSANDRKVHRRLARVRDRNRHLFLASVLALLAALVGWILGLDLEIRVGAVAVAAVAAWLIPLHGSIDWALDWIGERAGLSYQTALEMDGSEDRYGLREAVEERANASLAKVERPEHPAWWLPLIALALGALLLPALPIGSGGGLGGGPIPPGFGGQTPNTAAEEEQAEEAVPNLPGEERTRVAQTPEGGQPNDERGEESGAEGDGQSGEREALERYLQNIRERPAQSEEEQQDPGGEVGQAPSGAAPREGGQERPGGGDEGGSEGERSGEGEGERSGQQGEEGAEQGEPGQEGGEQGQNPFAQAGENEGEGQGDGAQPQAESAEPPTGNPGDQQLEEGGEQTTGPGDSPAGGDQQGQGQGAGALPSAEQEAGRAGAVEGETLQLRGDLREGPLSSGGTIQLPGGDEVELPPGRTPDAYAREVERAVTEGRVPIEYQEIIRNYFR